MKTTIEELARMDVDTSGTLTGLDPGNTTFPFDMTKLSDAGWAVSHETIFETMARLEHPDAEAVLTMLGKHADNKKTAKAARRAAYKAASRRASRRYERAEKASSWASAQPGPAPRQR